MGHTHLVGVTLCIERDKRGKGEREWVIPSQVMSRRAHEDNVATRALRRKIVDLRAEGEMEEGELGHDVSAALDFGALSDAVLAETEAAALDMAQRARAERERRENERRTLRWKNLVAHFTHASETERRTKIEALAALWMRDAPHVKYWTERTASLMILAKDAYDPGRYVGTIDIEGKLITAASRTCNLTEKGPESWP